MFVCMECGKTFSKPVLWEEKHGLDFGPYEWWTGSPCCMAHYTKTFWCDCCNEWITGDYVKTKDGERFCERCITHYELGDED